MGVILACCQPKWLARILPRAQFAH